jgi:hypothetical protein
VGVRDHQLDATQAPLLEVGDELGPEGLALAVAHLETQQLAAAIGIDAHRHHRGTRGDLLGLALAAIEIRGIQVHIGVAAALQWPIQKRLHLLVDLLADATHLRLGDAALGAQRPHQGIDLAGGDPTDVGLHDHRIQGLIDPAARLEDRGDEAACPQLGDLQREIPHLGGEGAGAVAVAIPQALVGALMAVSTEEGGNLQLDQLLQAVASQLGDQLTGAAAIE